MFTNKKQHKISPWGKKILLGLVMLALVAMLLGAAQEVQAGPAQASSASNGAASNGAASGNSPDGPNKIYLPVLVRNSVSTASNPILLGVYTGGWLGHQSTIDNELKTLDAWSGKKHALVGVFHRIDDSNIDMNVRHLFTLVWDNGYTPFVNLWVNASAAQVANGSLDSQYLRPWARSFAQYANGGSRMAYIAPLPEMNIAYTSEPYGRTPEDFKRAYHHIQQVFAEEGVPAESVQWVFAPNGWSAPGDPGFETYYPGHDVVDLVALSGYNFGYHPFNCGECNDWITPQEAFGTYLQRMRALAPNKAIIIAQTGTTAYYSNGYNVNQKNSWLQAMYTYLAREANVRGIVYYNDSPDYDWSVYEPGSVAFTGYIDGISASAYQYLAPVHLMSQGLFVP